MNDPEKKPIVVLDTSSIYMLTAVIPEKYLQPASIREGERPTFLDALVKLAKIGEIELVIPEMVCWETVHQNADGNGLTQGMSKHMEYAKLQERLAASSPFYGPMRKQLEPIINGEVPNAAVVRPAYNDKTAPAELMRKLKSVFEEYYSYINFHSGKLNKAQDIAVHRTLMGRLKAAQEGGTNQFGDIAIKEFIAGLPRKEQRSVVCLTKDNGLHNDLLDMNLPHEMVVVNTKAFARIMDKFGLLKPMGVKQLGDEAIHEIIDARDLEVCSFLGTNHSKNVGFVDTTHHKSDPQDHVFSHLIGRRVMSILAKLNEEKPKEDVLTPEQEARFQKTMDAQRAARLAKFSRKPLGQQPKKGESDDTPGDAGGRFA